MAGKKKTAVKRRTGPSPAMRKLQDQLAARGRAVQKWRKEAKAGASAGTIMLSNGLVGTGGAAAGAVVGVLGPGMWGHGAAVGVALLLLLIGAFMVPGRAGAMVAAPGGGMLAKVLGDLTEGVLGGEAAAEVTE